MSQTAPIKQKTGAMTVHTQSMKLTVMRGINKGLVAETEGIAIRVGLSERFELTLTDPTVSKKHAEIVHDQRGFILRDLGSTNGTWLGTTKIDEALINHNTTFRVGRTLLLFELLDEDLEVAPLNTPSYDGIIGSSQSMQELFSLIERVAKGHTDLLLNGPMGSGKMLVAKTLHRRAGVTGDFISVNCANSQPKALFTLLFGDQHTTGAIEQAHNGTLFLDHFHHLPYHLQEVLLSALSTREYKHPSTQKLIEYETRVIASTNYDLRANVAVGRFNASLFYYFANITVEVPHLKDRRQDLVRLADNILLTKGSTSSLDTELIALLKEWRWPGNISELKMLLTQLDEASTDDIFNIGLLKNTLGLKRNASTQKVFTQLDRNWHRELLRRAGSVKEAALTIGIDRNVLTQTLKSLKIS